MQMKRLNKVCLAIAFWTLCVGVSCAQMTNGMWLAVTGGNWSESGNWTNGAVAGGPGTTARFNVAPGVAVTADTEVVVGKLQFDSASGNSWALRGGPVRFEAALPEIQADRDTVSLYAPVVSTNGFKKVNGGTLRLFSRNAVDGEVLVETGTVSARGDLLEEPAEGMLTNVFSTGAPSLRFLSQSGATFELAGKNNRANQQTFSSVALDNQGYLTANFSGSGTTLVDGGPLSGTGLLGLFGNGDVRFDGSRAFEGSLRMRSGRLTFRPAAQKALRPAYGPAAHFDASQTNTLVMQEVNGTNFVTRWNSLAGGRYAYHDGYVNPRGEQVLPFLVTNALNGLSVIDFGKMYPTNMNYRSMGAYLLYDTELTAVRTAFIVLKSENFVLTARDTTQGKCYHRAANGWTAALLADRGETVSSFRHRDATSWKNGAVINPFSVGLTGQNAFDVLCFENGGFPASVGTFAHDRTYRFGGQVIAEAIIYNRALTAEERQGTEDYLRAKWQNVAVAAPTDDASVREFYSESAIRELEVAPEATVRVERLSGPRVTGLSGGGRLELERGGLAPVLPVTLKDGTLALKAAGAAMAAKPETSPISNPFFHVDASRLDTLTVDAESRVLEWRGTGYATDGRAAYAVNSAANPAPTLSLNALNGLPFVDFGRFNGGQMMRWNHTNTTIQTAFLVYADPGVDSWLLGDASTTDANFHRGTGGLMLYTGYRAAGLVSGQTYLNGRTVDPERTFLPNEPAVITFALTSNLFARASAFACDRWVTDKTSRTGDQKLCEVVLYNRYLPPAERRAVEAWLMRKWLPVQPAGYAMEADGEAVGELRAAPDAGQAAAVEVAAGATVSVGPLSGTGALEKTGAGTLKVAGFDDFEGPLKLSAGAVEVKARALPEPFELPGGLAFHLDASAAASVRCDADGVSVTNLVDASGGARFAVPADGQPRPQLLADALNGLPVIDFGVSSNGCCLLWDAPVRTVRTVFWVIGSQAGGGMPLGTKAGADGTDFLRSDVGQPGVWNGGSSKTLSGATRIGGRLVNGALAGLGGGYQVMSLVTPEPATASAFAADRFAGADAARMARTGGQRLGEVLVYNRVLSDVERRDVEAYLNRKWFGRLPQGYAGAGVDVARVELAGGELRSADAGAEIAIRSLLGATNLVKTGSHTLSLYQAHEFSGQIVVSNGVLALAGTPISSALPQVGMLMHMDAAQAETFTTVAENGTNFITRWNSKVGPRYAAHDGQSKRPYMLEGALNGRPVVEFGPYFDQSADRNNGAYLDWDQEVSAIKTVFLVLGTQEGGNFLLSSRVADNAPFHRAYDANGKVSMNAALLAAGRPEVPQCMRTSGAYASIDGVKINPFVTTPSGGYQVFCFQTDGTAAVQAGTFARDRTWRFGGQRLAEFILYDRVIPAEERMQVEAYLQDKWFARAYGTYVRDVPLADVRVAAGGRLDLSGATRSVASLSGTGMISNGTLRVTSALDVGSAVGECAAMTVAGGLAFAPGAEVLFDYASPAHDSVAVSGALTFEEAGSFVMRLTESHFAGDAMRVAFVTFGELQGAVHLKDWKVTGLPEAYAGTLVAEGQTVYVVIRLKGTVLLLK
jgi:hypothetical protein